jgi:hypothetical protein
MERPLPEMLASQGQMLRRLGTYKDGADSAAMSAACEKHLREVNSWLESKPYLKVLRVRYHDVPSHAAETARRIVGFLELDLNVDAMAQPVDRSLYRNPVS